MEETLVTETTTQAGKKKKKAVKYINPSATNDQVKGFAQQLTALTTETHDGAYVASYRTKGEVVFVEKPLPNLSIGGWSVADTVYSANISYDGDGALSTDIGSISNGVLTINDADGNFSGLLTASGGVSFATTTVNFNYATNTVIETVGGGGKPIPELTVGEWSGLTAPITYTGDGTLGVVGGSLSSTVLTASGSSGIIYARETDNFAAVITDWEAGYIPFLVVNMPFDTSTTQDLCGGTWTTSGSPTISDGTLYLDSSSYLQKSSGITLGGQDFTICGWFNALKNNSHSRPFSIGNYTIEMFREYYSAEMYARFNGDRLIFTFSFNTWHYFELDYSHSAGQMFVFLDGVLKGTITRSLSRTNFSDFWIGNSPDNWMWYGYIDDFKIYDGVALHNATFTPPVRPA